MHIPDGFIDLPVAAVTGAVSATAVAYAVKKTGADLGERTVPLLGVTAAFIFAAQMLNFPIAGGTSGHFLGAALAAALMGPWAAMVVMTVVVVVQALGMADGGITALGANVLNMGVVAVLVGWGLLHLLKRILPRSRSGYLVSLAVASWASVVVASAAAAAELAISGTVPLRLALPAMLSVHMVIALGEALITCAVLVAVLAARPDLVTTAGPGARFASRPGKAPATVPGPAQAAASVLAPAAPATAEKTAGADLPGARPGRRTRFWAFVSGALVVAVALAVFVSPFASSTPDGLERVAADQGFDTAAAEQPIWDLSPLGDYQFPGIAGERMSTALAGLLGTLALFVIVLIAGRALGRRRVRAVDRSDPGSHPA